MVALALLLVFISAPTTKSQEDSSSQDAPAQEDIIDGERVQESVKREEDVDVEEIKDPEIVQINACTYRLTLVTTASQHTIWKLWEDVDNWKDYDTILEYSYLEDNAQFAVGATGYVKADGAPKTKFEIIQVDPGNSFIESLKLPLWSTLELKRYVSKNQDGKTIFTHEVEFKGFMKHAYYLLLAKTFKKELYLVMGRMRALAESRELKL